ncbi:MAG TPA: GNAT family N-acetyltransferase [Xenococcaceae cyanobacterium]|jgi:ribosomal protein S18 acetylase RimI-like enzyme
MITQKIEPKATYDIERIIKTLVLAFSNDPVVRWMYPFLQNYVKFFPEFIQALGSKAFEQETVYCTSNYSGIAFWLPPNIHPDANTIVELLKRTIPQQRQAEVFAVLEQMGNYHPNEPHWYLAMIGVEPTQQKQGYGSALIQPALDICDRHKQIAYLESSKAINIPFYKSHGFEIIGTIKAGKSPTLFPMLRYPR